jgi:hypothetical protein
MPTASYLAELAKVSREQIYLVRITVAGDVAGSTTFKFSPSNANLISVQIGEDVRPYMRKFTGRPVRIRPETSITENASISITFFDDEDAPDFDSSVFSIFTGGSFWKRLILAQPAIIGSKVELLRGFKEDGFLESDFEVVFSGRWEDYKFNNDRTITIKSKDLQVLTNVEAPSQISEVNLISGAITAVDITFNVDDNTEITDPDSLGSKDQMPVVIRIDPGGANEEDVIIKGFSGSTTVLVQDNFLEFSEDFTDVIWLPTGTTTVNGAFSVGPFGVDSLSDQLLFPAVNDTIFQNPPVSSLASQTWVFSVWLRSLAGGTITLEVDEAGGDNFSSQVTVDEKWVRHEIVAAFTGGAGTDVDCIIKRDTGDLASVQVHGAQFEKSASRGFYVATEGVGTVGFDAGRGAFLTDPATHSDDDAFLEVMIYQQRLTEEGISPVVILRDLISRSGIGDADIDLDIFNDEFDADTELSFRRAQSTAGVDTTIISPQTLTSFITEVRKQSLIDVWVSEQGKYKAKSPLTIRPGDTVRIFTDEENIVYKSSSLEGNTKDRVTRVLIYYNIVVDVDGSEPSHFSNVRINVDIGVEADSGPKVRVIFSKWIYRAAEASQVAESITSRFRRGAKRDNLAFDIKDDADIIVGSVVALNSEDILLTNSDGSIGRGNSFWQVTQKIQKREMGQIQAELVLISEKRIGFISPETIPGGTFPDDIDNASIQQLVYGFIGTAAPANKVNNGTKDGYVIL